MSTTPLDPKVDASRLFTPSEQALLQLSRRKLKSRKFWLSLVGVVLPVVIQLLTGAVTWPIAVGLVTAAIVTYLLGQAHVDAKLSDALAAVVRAEVEKRLPKV